MYILYIYDLSGEIIAQISEIINLELELNLNDKGTANINIHHTNPYANMEILKLYRKVKITLLENNAEKIMFEGVIRGIESSIEQISIKMETMEHLLERRIIHQNYSFSSVSVDSIIQTILDEINTRYDTLISLDCKITNTISKDYSKGQDFLSIIQDIAGDGYEFIVKNNILYFDAEIGEDRTLSNDFVEYRYDINEPDERTINTINKTTDGKELSNGVLGKSGTDYSEDNDSDSINEFGLIETTFFNSGDIINATSDFLENHKQPTEEYEISVKETNFFKANLGDKIKIYINIGNNILFFDGSMKIISKNFTSGDLPEITYKVNTTIIRSKNIIEQFNKIKNKIQYIELNI